MRQVLAQARCQCRTGCGARRGLLWRWQEAPDGTCNNGLETAGRRTRAAAAVAAAAAAAAGPDALGRAAIPQLLSHRSTLPLLNHAVPAHPVSYRLPQSLTVGNCRLLLRTSRFDPKYSEVLGHFALLQVTRVVVPMQNYTSGATIES